MGESRSSDNCCRKGLYKRLGELATLIVILVAILLALKYGIPGVTGPWLGSTSPAGSAEALPKPADDQLGLTTGSRHPKNITVDSKGLDSVTPSSNFMKEMESIYDSVSKLEEYVSSPPVKRPSEYLEGVNPDVNVPPIG